MFGGEDKIPANVKDAMKLEDYGHGRPLTVRRITIVKAKDGGGGESRTRVRSGFTRASTRVWRL